MVFPCPYIQTEWSQTHERRGKIKDKVKVQKRLTKSGKKRRGSHKGWGY